MLWFNKMLYVLKILVNEEVSFLNNFNFVGQVEVNRYKKFGPLSTYKRDIQLSHYRH